MSSKLTTYPKTGAGLREMLFDAMEDVLSHERKPDELIALSKAAHQILASVRLEFDLQALFPKKGHSYSLVDYSK